MRYRLLFLILLAAPVSAQTFVWPGQTGNSVGYAAAPGWPGSFTGTACSAPSSGSSWATAVVISNCTYTGTLTITCNYCEFIYVDFKGNSGTGNWNFNGAHELYLGDRFQSNETEAGNTSINGGSYIYLFYDSFEPLVSLVSSPPGSLWPSAGAGANSTTMTSGVNDTPAADGYEFSFTPNSGPFWVDHCDFWGFANSVDWLSTTTQSTFTNNWVHDARDPVAYTDHTDGIGYLNGATGPTNLLIVGNTIATLGTTQDVAFQSATGGYSNIYLVENFISGDGATLALCQPGSTACTNSQLYGNVYGTDVMPGDNGGSGNPIYNAGNTLGSGTVWACNTISVRSGTTWTSGTGWTPTSGMNGQYFLNSNAPNSTTDQGGNTVCAITTPSSINFGEQASGTSSSGTTVTLYATNTSNLTGISATLAIGTQFSISSNTCGSTLTSGSNCAITVKFSPTGVGPATDTLQIADNSTGVTSPQQVPLSGLGTTATQASPPSCTPITGTYSGAQNITCTNPNSGTTVMCYSLITTPVTNGLGTGCTTGTQYSTAINISSTSTLNIVAGTSTLADSSVTSYTYTIVIPTPLAPPVTTLRPF